MKCFKFKFCQQSNKVKIHLKCVIDEKKIFVVILPLVHKVIIAVYLYLTFTGLILLGLSMQIFNVVVCNNNNYSIILTTN